MATIVQRIGQNGKKTWQAQIRKKGYPRQTKTFDRKSDATRWAVKVERQMDESTWREVTGADSLLIRDALKKYLDEVSIRKRPKTRERDKLSVKYLDSDLGSITLTQLTPSRIATYRDNRLKAVSAHSVRIELALLSNLYNVARKEWGLGTFANPVQMVKRPQIPEGRCPILSEQQICRLVDKCQKSKSRYLYPFVLLALHTGCRSAELRGLRWSQVNLEDGYISLIGIETKTHRSRVIPLTQSASSLFRDLQEKSGGSVLVFPSQNDSKKPRDLHIAFDRAVRAAGLHEMPGIGKLRIHDLRHLCATFLLMNGADIETVRALLGHKDLSTTQRYLHVVNEHKMNAISKINKLGIKANIQGNNG
jgi:integrase